MKKYLFIFITIFIPFAFSHGNEKTTNSSPNIENHKIEGIENTNKIHDKNRKLKIVQSYDFIESIKAIPSYHPLIIHFPIVLLPFALTIFGVSLIFIKNLLIKDFIRKLGFIVTLIGCLTAIIVGTVLHPHLVKEAPLPIIKALENHDFWAYCTIYSSVIATILIGFYFVPFIRIKNKIILLDISIIVVLSLSTLFVSITGHYGAVLTHLYGVGPQGQYLQQNHN